MTAFKHNDEALAGAQVTFQRLLADEPGIIRASLVDDLFGRLRAVIEIGGTTDGAIITKRLKHDLLESAGTSWSGDVWVLSPATPHSDRSVYEAALSEGAPVLDRLRLTSRPRSRVAWWNPRQSPPWPLEPPRSGPIIVAFCSFKGGVGRTTALAAFALQRARLGEHVVVVDLDLDAPGVGRLLAADEAGTVSPWGVVDYLLEAPFGAGPLEDYYHRCGREAVTGEDSHITVFPGGRLDEGYLRKLARVDLELDQRAGVHPFESLLSRIHEELKPEWILVDSRAGLSPASSLLFAGLAHLYVLFATGSEQSYPGLERMIHQLGAARLNAGFEQADCLVVQSMVPDNRTLGVMVEHRFNECVRDLFVDHYLVAADDDPEDKRWSVRELDTSDGPHVPIPVRYREAFAFFPSIDVVADELAGNPDYVALGERILARCLRNEDQE
jgi:cellulose biosynthesis protein BcsQ